MATATIQSYTSAGSTDAVNDYFVGYNNAAAAYRKYNRNTLLGITGNPVGTTDTQTLTAKTLTAPTISAPVLAGTVTGTYTFGGTPTFPSSVVTLTGTQTLTNKTLTSPVITGGTISNATITVDTISGFSGASVSVAGVTMNAGIITTSGAVTSTSIAVGAVQPQALVTGTGTGWTWASWTPTYTNLTVGNGTSTARFIQIGKTVFFRLSVVFGTTSAVSGSVTFTFPVTSIAYTGTATTQTIAMGSYNNAGTAVYQGGCIWASTTTANMLALKVDGTYSQLVVLSATVPFTFGSGAEIFMQGSYEAA